MMPRPPPRGPCRSPASQDWSSNPAISPAGNFVAFAWEGEGGDNFDIYVRVDRWQLLARRLTNDAAADHAPAWSPDGQRIAFVRVLGRKARDCRCAGSRRSRAAAVRGRAGSVATCVLVGWSYGLSWTPDGKHLVFGDRSAPVPRPRSTVYSFEDGKKRQLTRPPANLSDIHPVFLRTAGISRSFA